MQSSHATFPGLSHLQTACACQDFCLTGVKSTDTSTWAYAIVSDGCSTAGRTDIGAALLTQLAHSWLQTQHSPPDPQLLHHELHRHLLEQLRMLQSQLALTPRDLMATLLILIATPHRLYGLAWGDGAVLVQTSSSQTLFCLNAPLNTPSYLAYQLTSTPPPPLASWESTALGGQDDTLRHTTFHTSTGAVAFHIEPLDPSLPLWHWAGVSSDGLPPSLISKDIQMPQQWTGPGQFVPRELSYAWRTLWKKQPSKHPSDDCALAVIRQQI